MGFDFKRTKLSRETTITKLENGERKEYKISFDELEVGDLLGRGQFGTVKKMYHKQTDMTFAVKVDFHSLHLSVFVNLFLNAIYI